MTSPEEPVLKKTRIDDPMEVPAATLVPAAVKPAPGPAVIQPASSTKLQVVETVKRQRQMSAARLGDKEYLRRGYDSATVCHGIVQYALDRAAAAQEQLDDKHAQAVGAMKERLLLKTRNANTPGYKEDVPVKRAIALATKADMWIYQAQAAASKSAVKQAKKCLSRLSGRKKLSKEEKEARYLKRYGKERGTKADRTLRKVMKRQKRA